MHSANFKAFISNLNDQIAVENHERQFTSLEFQQIKMGEQFNFTTNEVFPVSLIKPIPEHLT